MNLLRIAFLMFAGVTTAALAQGFPSHPITMINPGPAGGAIDVPARLLAKSMSEALKQPILMENVAGGGGLIATARLAKAPADGYTVLFHHIGIATSHTLYRRLPYSTFDDLEPVGLSSEVPMVVIARKDLPAKDVKSLVALLQKGQKGMFLATSGVGSVSQLCGMLLMAATQSTLTTVPYKGSPTALLDLVSGRTDVMCDQTTTAMSFIRNSSVKTYGVTTKSRLDKLPDIPTMDEAGLKGFEVTIWQGFYVPAKTPKAVVDRLAGALQSALRDDELKKGLNALGIEPVSLARATPEAHKAYLKAEVERWARIIKASGEYAD